MLVTEEPAHFGATLRMASDPYGCRRTSNESRARSAEVRRFLATYRWEALLVTGCMP